MIVCRNKKTISERFDKQRLCAFFNNWKAANTRFIANT